MIVGCDQSIRLDLEDEVNYFNRDIVGGDEGRPKFVFADFHAILK